MNHKLLYRICLCWLLLVSVAFTSKAQQLSFRHLGIAEGLPSNIIGHACFDSTGFVWMATNDGLISYDGTRISQYLKETHPALPRNEIGFLFCDSRNRIWICTNEGLALMDEKRRITRVIIHDSLKNANIDFCFEVEGLGIIASSTRKTYLLPQGKTQWQVLNWFDKNIRKGAGITNLRKFNGTSYMFVMDNKAMLINFANQKILTDVPIENLSSICKLNDKEVLATSDESFILYKINIGINSIVKIYNTVKDVKGVFIKASIFASSTAADGTIYLSTRSGGLIGFDASKEIFYSYRHEALNSNTISSDILRWIFCRKDGYIIITSTSGLNYTNVLSGMFEQRSNFIDEKGKIINGGITGVGEDINGNIWIKGINKLFIWNPKSNTSTNITSPLAKIPVAETTTESGTIYKDNQHNMWVTYNGKGLAKFNADGRLIKFLSTHTKSLPVNGVRVVRQLPNSVMIVGADNRLFMLHPQTFTIDSFDTHPLLKAIAKKRIVDMLPDGDKIWIASSPNGAAYCYNFKEKTLATYTTANGLSSNRVYCLAKDSAGSMYIGTYDGLNIINPQGSITIINKHNGLRHPRVENIVTDRLGKVWITNFNSLISYNPATKTFQHFDERNGVSNAGFSVVGNTTTKAGKIIFSNSGLLVVDPNDVKPEQQYKPALVVHRLYDDGGYELLQPKDSIKLEYDNAKLSLYYLTNTLITSNRFFYHYKLQGLDSGWQQPTKNNQVTYNLKPGKYHFLIQTSYNEGGWINNDTRITIIVLPPWWQTWWFRIFAIGIVGLFVFYLFRRRVKTIKNKAAIKQQLAELEAKAIRAQMNPHFIFNSLNAIQECIVTEKVDAAYDYLSRFSKLLRLVLDNSDRNLIPLSSELETIGLYLSLESLRFSQSFGYEIIVDENLDKEDIYIPSLLLQPFVENAIWHGLINKEGEKKLLLHFSEKIGRLECVIEDNGVGRAKAEAIKQQKLAAAKLESKGTKLALHRIEVLNEQHPGSAVIEIIDLKDSNGNAAGTRVIINLSAQLSVNKKSSND
ncbi:sensor histidine kinase [Ferruginibacter sp.]